MTQTLWIVVVVVAVLVVVAVVLGLVLRRNRRISLRERQQPREELPPRRGNTYQAEGGFDFSAGTDRPAPPRARPDTAKGPQTGAPPTRPDGPRRARRPESGASPTGSTAYDTPPFAGTTPTASAPSRDDPSATGSPRLDTGSREVADATGGSAPALLRSAPDPATQDPATQDPATQDPAARDLAAGDAAAGDTVGDTLAHDPVVAEPVADTVAPARPAGATAARPPAPESSVIPVTPSTTLPVVVPAAAAPSHAPTSNGTAPPTDITPAEGRLERLRGRLARSRTGFGQGLLALLGAGELDEESWEDVEAMLLQADLGPEMTIELVETLRTELARRAVRTTDQARALLRDVLTDALRTDLDRSVRALPHDGRPGVLLVVGVNGTGKTTTTGKLARVLVASGRHVVLGAADTFRAAAAEQLATWGERAGATVVRGPEGADPASVAFDAVKQGTVEGADAVLLDTAGRLHTKTGLMDELGKVKRVVSRQALVDEVLLVLDATTGQNGLTQARVFSDAVDVTGIVLTKLDGTAKGGIVFRVQRELGVPVKLVGLGEGPDDLAPFEPSAFVDALLE